MTTVPPAAANLRGALDLSSLVNRPAPGSAPAGSALAVPALIMQATDATFSEVLDLSMQVPVVVDLWAEWCEPCKQLTPVLEKLVAEFDGRFVLAKIDVDANPQLAQAFQAQSIPTVAAVIGGQPVQLFTGALPEAQVRQVLQRMLELASQNGVTGVAKAEAASDQHAEPEIEAEPELPPHHRAAYDAIDRGDYSAAIAEYKAALAEDPRDTMAVAGLAQVNLLARLQGKSLEAIRSAAGTSPDELEAQLLVADLDLSGGHVQDAFDRLLDLFPKQDAAGRNVVRERLLEYFQVVGIDDARVAPARARLAALLY